MSRSAQILVRIAVLFVLSQLVAAVLTPADPMSMYILMGVLLVFAYSSFWMGLRIGPPEM